MRESSSSEEPDSNQAITVGGVDKDEKDAVNELTYAMLRATELMMLRDPNLNARYYHGVNSEAYLRRLCEVNIATGATPALHNDQAVIRRFSPRGKPRPRQGTTGSLAAWSRAAMGERTATAPRFC